MASSKSKSKSKSARGKVSLADEDRLYLSERLGEARGRGAATGSESEGVLFEALERFGLSSQRVERLRGAFEDMDVRESVDKAQEYLSEQIENARDYARDNPKKVIGGAAGVLVGASLLAIALRRASGEEKKSRSRSSSASTAGGSKKSSSRKRSSGSRGSRKSSGGGSKKSSGGGSKKSSTKRSTKRR